MASNSRRIEGFLTLDITDFTRKMSMVDTHLSSSTRNFGSFNTAMGDTTAKAGSAGSAVDKVGQNASNAGTSMGRAGQTGTQMGNDISRGANVGATSLNKVSTNARGVSDSLDGITMAMGGVVAGFGAMQMVEMAWTGSTQAQFNKAYLATKMTDTAAQGYIKTIQDTVNVVPGDDTFLNQLLTGAVARQTNLTTAQITSLAYATADYTTVSQAMGKSQIETQMDLKEYVQTGNTSQLERDSILKNQMGTLEDQATVSDRILALNKALQAEGYAGLSKLDIASIKWEELKGKVQAVATSLGTDLLPTVQGVIEWFIGLDTATGGWSTKLIFLGAGVIAVSAAFGMLMMALAPVVGGLSSLIFGMVAYQGISLATIASTMGTSAAFGVLGTAIWTAIAPFLPFIAIGVALGGVIYLLGQHFGWWTDLGSMAGTIWNGLVGVLTGLWDVMIGFMSWVGGVATNVWDALTSSFYDSEGNFVGLIQGFQNLGGLIWSAVQPGLYTLPGQIWGFLTGLPGMIYTALTTSQQGSFDIAGMIVGWFGSVDWMGVIQSLIGGLVSINPVTIITRLLFGDKVADQASAFAVEAIMGFLTTLGSLLTGLYNTLAPIAGGIVSALQPIICIILGCSPGIVPALQSLYSWFTSIFGAIWNFLSPVANMIINGLQGIWGALSQGDIMGVFMAGFSTLGNIGSYIIGFISSVDWNGIFLTIFSTIAGFASQYNPATWIATLLFGPDAGVQVTTTLFSTLMNIGTMFVTGLHVVWAGLMGMVTFVQGIWNSLIFATQFAWGLLQLYILNPARAIWTTIQFIWNSIWTTINTVWTRLQFGAISTFNTIKNAILNPFNTVKSILNTVWNGLKSGWNTLVSTFGSGATRLKNLVMSPIKTVYNGLVDLWNLVTGSKVPKMAGSAGVAGGKGLAGSIGMAGPGPIVNSGGGSSLGIISGITNTVRGFINNTANRNGLSGRFAGPRPAGLGRGPPQGQCDPDEPCYAGWDGISNWEGRIESILTSWPTKANIGGIQVTTDLMDSILNGGGNMAIFDYVASQIIGKTRYEYYYNARYSDAEVIKGGRCNCFDGAELLINLAHRLNLPAYMGHGTWGADGHAFAVIGNQVRDTTAFQKGYGWRSPKVRGYPSAGPGPRSSGPSSNGENHFHFDMRGSQINGISDLEKQMEKTANKVYTKRTIRNGANGS